MVAVVIVNSICSGRVFIWRWISGSLAANIQRQSVSGSSENRQKRSFKYQTNIKPQNFSSSWENAWTIQMIKQYLTKNQPPNPLRQRWTVKWMLVVFKQIFRKFTVNLKTFKLRLLSNIFWQLLQSEFRNSVNLCGQYWTNWGCSLLCIWEVFKKTIGF